VSSPNEKAAERGNPCRGTARRGGVWLDRGREGNTGKGRRDNNPLGKQKAVPRGGKEGPGDDGITQLEPKRGRRGGWNPGRPKSGEPKTEFAEVPPHRNGITFTETTWGPGKRSPKEGETRPTAKRKDDGAFNPPYLKEATKRELWGKKTPRPRAQKRDEWTRGGGRKRQRDEQKKKQPRGVRIEQANQSRGAGE